MDCLNPYCQNEVAGDYPLCKDCAPTRHFEYRDDCCCDDCHSDYAMAVEEFEQNVEGVAV